MTVSDEPSAPPAASSSTRGGQRLPAASQPAATLHCKRSALSSFLSNDAVTKAEVLWALQIIAKHQSYRSCDKLKELFQEMFSDSDIAGKFTLNPTGKTPHDLSYDYCTLITKSDLRIC